LKKEYLYLSVFCLAFSILIYFAVDFPESTGGGTRYMRYMPYTTVAFYIGAATSMLCGFIAMRVAVYTNVRTTWCCNTSIFDCFHVAFKGGKVLGFALVVGICILILQLIIIWYRAIVLTSSIQQNEADITREVRQLFEMVAGYGLGGSTVALFGRVGGGIYFPIMVSAMGIIALTIWTSFTFAGMYGVLATIGMLGCLPLALAIDGYAPIADNAGGISEMSNLDHSVRENTNKLDAAGNTTVAIGKGFRSARLA
jgi:Na+/H+-translocating membrane pyrophosphatase